MIKIKDYIFNENEIKSIEKLNEIGIKVIFKDNKSELVRATFEDIEWNYENFNNCKKLEEVILARDARIKELEEENQHIFANVNDDELLRSNAMMSADIYNLNERINKAIEYIGNGNIGIPKKTREKFIKILKGEE